MNLEAILQDEIMILSQEREKLIEERNLLAWKLEILDEKIQELNEVIERYWRDLLSAECHNELHEKMRKAVNFKGGSINSIV